jgi:glyoxylase-like metal-dependent hydrolase (beta-lactamase superfamily II)
MPDAPAYEVIRAPNPSFMTGSGTNSYVAGEGDSVIVVDPGPAIPEHLDALAAAARARGLVTAVVLTHHHADHSEAAAAFAKRCGAPLLAYPHPSGPDIDGLLADGDRLACGEGSLEVLHTPGHCPDHLCFRSDDGSVFAGDLVAGEGYIVVDPPEGNMVQYLASLARLRDLAPSRLLPGHGPAIEGAVAYLGDYIAHRLARESKVIAALHAAGNEGATLEALLPVVYDDVATAMLPAASRSLVAHLEKLVSDGRVSASGEEPAARYRAIR